MKPAPRPATATTALAALLALLLPAACVGLLLMYSCGLHPHLSPPQTAFWRFHPQSTRLFCGPADTGAYLLAGGWRHPLALACAAIAALAATALLRSRRS